MRMYDIIHKKREGGELTGEELRFFVQGFTRGEIPDYQASALLMAIFFRGMTRRETGDLTLEMARSGDTVDLSSLPGVKVDKHSTGGVGDKTSLIIGPIAAACGVTIAKMSGRGLGHTGGTVDKLESIPGLRTDIPRQEFFDIVKRTGLSIIGQSGNLCPADKKLYALRDVTATVESLPLIASSIMSKKIAAGADAILLDVKVGSGAFMKTLEDSRALAQEMVRIGSQVGRRTVALITDMDMPLGRHIGNALEVQEAVEVLSGGGDSRLRDLCLELSANMIYLGQRAETMEEARAKAAEAVSAGRALQKLAEMVEAQGGDPSYIAHPEKFTLSPACVELSAPQTGYITRLDAEGCGLAAVELGAGRETKESSIDFGAGIVLLQNKGDRVEQGQPIARLYAQSEALCRRGKERFLASLEVGELAPKRGPMIVERIAEEG
ncbi:MAG TPA: pyrimidine-nucleoside phosphorylase [Candidatus Acutalibacter pullicola]|uniref:Pyrimidine-nucleoside phosphorylase n=1 Tax=Candidatus Acutalibacter pullicola TaxID=2838417 RepID=A0A9D2MTY3_9FIRM|nr:pyrimidine-nucleoside phosphorylase [Candidatus Acutalibacter pullicola]